MNANNLIVVPTGFVIVMLATELTHGIRWCLSADKNDALRHGLQLATLLEEFLEARASGTGNSQLNEFMKSLG